MKVSVIPIIGELGTISKGLIKGLEDLKNQRTSGDPPDNSIIEISQNTENSFGDLRRLAVTQTPERAHQQTLLWKMHKE